MVLKGVLAEASVDLFSHSKLFWHSHKSISCLVLQGNKTGIIWHFSDIAQGCIHLCCVLFSMMIINDDVDYDDDDDDDNHDHLIHLDTLHAIVCAQCISQMSILCKHNKINIHQKNA